jgi:hypothetical protein
MRPLCLRCVALVLLWAGPALGAVRFDNAATALGSSGKASLQLNVGAGRDRFVLLAIVGPANVGIAQVSFGGRPLAPYGQAWGPSCRVYIYGAVAPASGAGTATVTLDSSSASLFLAAASYDGVHQSLPTDDNSYQNYGTGGTPTGNANNGGSVGGLAFGALCAAGSMLAASPRAGESGRWSVASGSLLSAGSDAPGLQVGWRLSGSGAVSWAVASHPLRAAPGGAAAPADAAAPPADAAPAPAPDAAPAPRPDAAPVSRDAATPDAAAEADARPVPAPPAADATAPPADGQFIPLPSEPPERTADASPVRVIDLRIGTGCTLVRASAPRSLAALAPLLLALLVVVARRNRR